jgi:hypothetical protein
MAAMAESTFPQDYRMSPELRRCCWYGIAGAVVCAATASWVAWVFPGANAHAPQTACIPFLLAIVALAALLRWKVRLDADGLTRRWLFRSDLWTWDDLASGRIRKLYPYTLLDPERPWWRRKLRLGHLAADDILAVFAAINTRYRLPPPPEIGDTLTIKWGLRRAATFDRKGVQISKRGVPRMFLWHEVRQIQFTRMDPLRRDFKRLAIVLPDEEIELTLVTHQGGTSPTWRGATPEELSEFLLRHLAPEQVDTVIAGEPLKREQIERKLKAARKSSRDLVIVLSVFGPLLLGSLVWMAIDSSVVQALVMTVFSAVFLGLLLVFIYRSQRKAIAELETLLKNAS